MLALKPGELTRRYIAGERARFVSPMALFLFSVFLMFAVFQIAGISAAERLRPRSNLNDADVTGDRAQLPKQLEGLRSARARAWATTIPAAPMLDAQIAAIERRKADAGAEDAQGDSLVGGGEERRGGAAKLTARRTGWAFLDHGIEKWQKNPGLMAYKLQANSYKFSWLLIPLSIPFVWLIFAWRRKFGAYDHAVFVTYSLSFMTLFFVALTLAGMAGVGAAIIANGDRGWCRCCTSTSSCAAPIRCRGSPRCGGQPRSASSSSLILLLFLNVLLVLGALG